MTGFPNTVLSVCFVFRVVSFVGSHFDVVPANPEEWSVDPFKLTRDGDKVSGRGVTDCLGHVAMITAFFKELGRHQPKLGMAVKALLIASEEASVIPDVGIDECQRRGELEAFRNGPLIWGSFVSSIIKPALTSERLLCSRQCELRANAWHCFCFAMAD